MGSGVGESLREAIVSFVEEMGQTILIHENYNSPQAKSFQVRGLKNSPSKQSSKIIFQFLEQLDIPTGAVLQVQGSRDLWRVTDIEDQITDDVFINLEVHVEKIDQSGGLLRPQQADRTVYNLHGTHSRVNVGSSDYSVNISGADVDLLFSGLRQAIEGQIASHEERAHLLKKIEEMEEAKGTPRFIERYKEFVAVAADHIGVVGAFLPGLTQLLGG